MSILTHLERYNSNRHDLPIANMPNLGHYRPLEGNSMSWFLSAESERLINEAVAELEYKRLQRLRAMLCPELGYSFDELVSEGDTERAAALGVRL